MPPDFIWTAAMVLKTIEIFLPIWIRNLIPECIFNDIRKIKTSISKEELSKILQKIEESVAAPSQTFENFKNLVDQLPYHESLPHILGLHGVLNFPTARYEGDRLSNRQWLAELAEKIFDSYHTKFLFKDTPASAKYVAMFEADKIAIKRLSYQMIKPTDIFQQKYQVILQKAAYHVLEQHNTKYENLCGEDLNSVEVYLFENKDYWLIPKFREVARNEMKGQQTFDEMQRYHLLQAKQYFKRFFELLAEYSPFNESKPKFDLGHETHLAHYTIGIREVFKRSALLYSTKLHQGDKTVEAFYERINKDIHPFGMAGADRYSELTPQFRKAKKHHEAVVVSHDDVKFMLPIVSSNNYLCLQIYQAMKIWKYLAVPFDVYILEVPTDALDELKRLMNKMIDYFEKHANDGTAINFETMMGFISEWGEAAIKVSQNQPVEAIPTANNDLDMAIVRAEATLSAKLYPPFVEAYTYYVNETSTLPNFLDFKYLCMLSSYPKAAIQLHKLGACAALRKDHNSSFCALDLVLAKELDTGMRRCDVTTDCKMVRAIRKAHNIPPEIEAPSLYVLNAMQRLMFAKAFKSLAAVLLKNFHTPENVKVTNYDCILANLPTFENIMYCSSAKAMVKFMSSSVSTQGISLMSNGMCIPNTGHLMEYDTLCIKRPMIASWVNDVCNKFDKHSLCGRLRQAEAWYIAKYITNNENVMVSKTEVLAIVNKMKDQCAISIKDKEEVKKVKKEKNIEVAIQTVVNYLFKKYEFPFEDIIAEELKKELEKSEHPPLKALLIKFEEALRIPTLKSILSNLPVGWSKSYWECSIKVLPSTPILDVISWKNGRPAFVFRRDFEMIRMIAMKKRNDYKQKNNLDTVKIFGYLEYDDVERTCMKLGFSYTTQFINVEMVDYGSCCPLVSPYNTPCKPVDIAIVDLFNFLDKELNVFCSLRQEHFEQLPKFVEAFCKEFELDRELQYCISYNHFQEFLEQGRALFADKVDDYERMKVDINYDESTLGLFLRERVKPGLMKSFDDRIESFTKTLISSSPTKWSTIIDKQLYQSFVLKSPQLCFAMHWQKKCGQFSETCLLRVHEQKGPHCDDSTEVAPDHFPEPQPEEESIQDPDQENEKSSSSSSSSDVVEAPQAESVVELNRVERAPKLCPGPAVPVVMYDFTVLRVILKMLCAKTTFEIAMKRKGLQLLEGWIDFQQVAKIMETVKKVIGPTFDNLLEEMKQLRQIPGSAMLYKIAKCIDWHSPDMIDISNEVRKTSLMKQDWLKSLPTSDYFGQRNDPVFELLIRHELDKMASRIGTAEIVTLKYPKNELEEMMIKLREELNKDRREKAVEFLEKHRNQNIETTTDEDIGEYLTTVALSANEDSNEFRKAVGEKLKSVAIDIKKKKEQKEKKEKEKKDEKEHTEKKKKEDKRRMEKMEKKEKEWKKWFIVKTLCQIHKATRIVEGLRKKDTLGITRKFEAGQMKKVPCVRSVRNGSIVFVADARFAFEVALNLRNDGRTIDNEILPLDDGDRFNFILKEQIDEISRNLGFHELPFEILNLEKEPQLKSKILVPMRSPSHTLCIEFGLVLLQVLHYLTIEKVFARISSLDQMNEFVDVLCQSFKPEKCMTFAMDYQKAIGLIENTISFFKDLKSLPVPRKSKMTVSAFIETESKLRHHPSFGVMLTSMLSGFTSLPSKDTLDEMVELADIRTFLFEYSKIAICYHSQKLCTTNGKKQFCSISLIDGEKQGYPIPLKCQVNHVGHVAEFRRIMKDKNMTRLVHQDVEMEDVKEDEELEESEEVESNIEILPDLEKSEDDLAILTDKESEVLDSFTRTNPIETRNEVLNPSMEAIESREEAVSDESVMDTTNSQNTQSSECRTSQLNANTSELPITCGISRNSSSRRSSNERAGSSWSSTSEMSNLMCPGVASIFDHWNRNKSDTANTSSDVYEGPSTSGSRSFQYVGGNIDQGSSRYTDQSCPQDHGFGSSYQYPHSTWQSVDKPLYSNNGQRSGYSEYQSRTYYDTRIQYHQDGSNTRERMSNRNDYWKDDEINRLRMENCKLNMENDDLKKNNDELTRENKEMKDNCEQWMTKWKKEREIKDVHLNIEYYRTYLRNGWEKYEEAKEMLENSILHGEERTRAETELEYFKHDHEVNTRIAIKNIEILENFPTFPASSLFKLLELPKVFSDAILNLMRLAHRET